MINPDLSHYGLWLANISSDQYENRPVGMEPEVTISFKNTTTGVETKLDQFTSDMEVMNKVRMSMDPAVKEAYEQMLTVMALTKGRTVTDDYGNTTTKK